MHLSVWSHDSNPAIDRRACRKSRSYCETEVAAGRATPINPLNLSAGIKMCPPDELARKAKTERRGSPESHGLLTANESHLNACYRGVLHHEDLDQQVRQLASEYEHRLEKHEAEGRKGLPLGCAVIAAKVKTILLNPVFAIESCTV